MRTLFMLFIALSTMAITLAAPLPASAYSNLVKFLTIEACEGQSAAYKNGCYAYLEPRILSSLSPDSSLASCNSRCNSWFSTNPSNGSVCKQGCQFIRSKE